MLIDEFGIDHDPEMLGSLSDTRETWRLTQTRAAVRDAPAAAVEALEDLGYSVSWTRQEAPPRNNSQRLRSR